MIELTRLNGSPLAVSCELIKYIESSPDTTLTLVTGEKIVVRESCADVIARAIAYRARLLRETSAAPPQAAVAQAAENASSARTNFSLAKTAEEVAEPR